MNPSQYPARLAIVAGYGNIMSNPRSFFIGMNSNGKALVGVDQTCNKICISVLADFSFFIFFYIFLFLSASIKEKIILRFGSGPLAALRFLPPKLVEPSTRKIRIGVTQVKKSLE